jgi:hypothetical protein
MERFKKWSFESDDWKLIQLESLSQKVSIFYKCKGNLRRVFLLMLLLVRLVLMVPTFSEKNAASANPTICYV